MNPCLGKSTYVQAPTDTARAISANASIVSNELVRWMVCAPRNEATSEAAASSVIGELSHGAAGRLGQRLAHVRTLARDPDMTIGVDVNPLALAGATLAAG
jgi:hypothetical protein